MIPSIFVPEILVLAKTDASTPFPAEIQLLTRQLVLPPGESRLQLGSSQRTKRQSNTDLAI
jgi:hypothetical protein